MTERRITAIALWALGGAGTLRAAPWGPRAAIAAMGLPTLLVAAVAGMTIRLQATGDPDASAVFTALTVTLAGLKLAMAALLLRAVAVRATGRQPGAAVGVARNL